MGARNDHDTCPAYLPHTCPVWCAQRDFIKAELPPLLRAYGGSMLKDDATAIVETRFRARHGWCDDLDRWTPYAVWSRRAWAHALHDLEEMAITERCSHGDRYILRRHQEDAA
jgi:hypothetical protein